MDDVVEAVETICRECNSISVWGTLAWESDAACCHNCGNEDVELHHKLVNKKLLSPESVRVPGTMLLDLAELIRFYVDNHVPMNRGGRWLEYKNRLQKWNKLLNAESRIVLEIYED